uniref:histone acetyltransferase n=1 Tax=Anopheles dirus TaxID=7168 RepID=A0A182NMR1_9DIPT
MNLEIQIGGLSRTSFRGEVWLRAMPEKVNQVSEEQWREWILEALQSIHAQKQCATFPRICFAIRKRHMFHEETIAARLVEAVHSGLIKTIFRRDETIYRIVKCGSEGGTRKEPPARKVRPPSSVLCIECLKPSLTGPKAHKPEPMSSCERCGISIHDSCTHKSNGYETAVPLSQLVSVGNRWFCEECKPCDGCSALNESLSRAQRCVVECAVCLRKFHFQCMDPPVPGRGKKLRQRWLCVDCERHERFSSRKDSTREPRPEPDVCKGNDGNGTRFHRPQPTEADLIDGRVEAMRIKLGNKVTDDDLDVFRSVLLKRCNLEQDDLERTPAAIRFGRHEIETWYSSPFPQEYAKLQVLYMCEFCLKYMKTNDELQRHQAKCSLKHPPGCEIYRDGDIAVFEVDGNDQKLYCQSLCLLAKLFLDHKTLYFDVEPFLFYLLTKRDHLGHHVVGYFSKEKCNQMRYNVSCILTMPQYQRQGYGQFLIEFSYLLSRVEQKPGTPERPLSDLGRLTYQQYWCSALLSYFYVNRDGTVTLDSISRETGMIAGDIVTGLRKLGFLRYRVERTGCIRSNRPFICIDWQRVQRHHERLMRSMKRIELREMGLRWIPNSRATAMVKQLELVNETSSAPRVLVTYPGMVLPRSRARYELAKATQGLASYSEPWLGAMAERGDTSEMESVEQMSTGQDEHDSSGSVVDGVTRTSTGRKRFKSRKYSDTMYDLSLSLTTGTPKTCRPSRPACVAMTERANSAHVPSAPRSKLPYVLLVPLKLSPASSEQSASAANKSISEEEVSLDSVEAFMGTPKSELQKSSPEKNVHGFTPIAPFRREDHDGTAMPALAAGDHADRICTPKTTRRRMQGNLVTGRKRIIDDCELLSSEAKRLRLNVALGADQNAAVLEGVYENRPVQQVVARLMERFQANRFQGKHRASLAECTVDANKMLRAPTGGRLPRTV